MAQHCVLKRITLCSAVGKGIKEMSRGANSLCTLVTRCCASGIAPGLFFWSALLTEMYEVSSAAESSDISFYFHGQISGDQW